jgi:4-amino-4-deoxy-L-arabinose transferase-like glycosyltransferase
MAAVVAVAAGFRLWGLDRNGFGNLYYAASVRSMLKGPANFLFAAFDPVGLVALDKPPVAVWIQAASAGVFGYRGLSMLVPQALMGAASVALTYDLVRRAFGAGAGLLAGLFLAVTPICVAVDRTNLPDTALVFVLLLAARALAAAVETGRRWPLLLSAALVGVGYNIKMLAAFVVLPTFALVYLVAAPVGLATRLGRLAAAGVVLVVVALSWSLAVELTPATRRPYLGGSRTNSAFELALGYNGLDRILGSLRLWGSSPGGGAGPPSPSAPPPFDGVPGALRFAGPVMAAQVTWLAPLALIGAAAAWPFGRGAGGSGRPIRAAWLLWVGWLGTHWVVFSFARGVLHEYYTIVMGPAVAALAGAGSFALWDGWRRGGWRTLLLPLALVATLAWQGYVLGRFPDWRRWLWPAVLTGVGIGAAGLLAARALRGRRATAAGESWAAGVALAALLICPVAWSLIPVRAKGDPMMPLADPSALADPVPGVPLPGRPAFELDAHGTRKLADFLRANRHGEPIAMASVESFLAAPLIIEADLPAVALGGFSGNDRAVTVARFAEMVRAGQVRFVLLAPGEGLANAALLNWIVRHGRPVDPGLWRSDEPAGSVTPPPGDPRAMFDQLRRETRLFDVRPDRGASVPAARPLADGARR